MANDRAGVTRTRTGFRGAHPGKATRQAAGRR